MRNCGNLRELDETAYIFGGMSEEEKATAVKALEGFQKVFALGDIRLYECPLKWITRETSDMMRFVFLLEETGCLPFAGPWVEQPHWFVEAYELCKLEVAEWHKKNMPKVPNGK